MPFFINFPTVFPRVWESLRDEGLDLEGGVVTPQVRVEGDPSGKLLETGGTRRDIKVGIVPFIEFWVGGLHMFSVVGNISETRRRRTDDALATLCLSTERCEEKRRKL